MNPLFELFMKENVNMKTVHKYITDLSEINLIDFINRCNNIIVFTDRSDKKNGEFCFVASDNISGGKTVCSEIQCRSQKAESLGRFSAMYADKVIVKNPFEDWINYKSINNHHRKEIINDITILLINQDLFNEGLFGFYKSRHHFCEKCLMKLIDIEKLIKKNNQIAKKIIKKEILNKTDFYIISNTLGVYIKAIGDTSLYEHEESYIHFQKNVDKLFVPYINSGKKLPIKILERTKLLDYRINSIYQPFIIQNLYINEFGFNSLTSSPIDVNLIKHFSKSTDEIESFIFLPNTKDTKKILNYRKKENDVFERFRDEFSTVLKEIKGKNQKEINDIINDKLVKETEKIKINISKNRKHLIKDGLKNIFIDGLIITAGLYSGILPGNVGELISTIGGFDMSRNLINSGIDIIKEPENIRNDPYYFFWKIKK